MKTSIAFLFLFYNLIFCTAYSQSVIEKKSLIADSLYQAGKTDSALLVNNEIIELAENEGNIINIIDAYSSRGVYLRSTGNLEKAAEEYDKALKHTISLQTETEESLQSIATLYNNLSTLYLDMKNPESA